MNQLEDTTGRTVIPKPLSAEGDFQETLSRVEKLLESGEVDRALETLATLHVSFLSASRFLDLMGEALLKKGRTKTAQRCKILYEALRGALGPGEGDPAHPETNWGERLVETGISESNDEAAEIAPALPVTEAMADELIRQGHLEHALKILSALQAGRPDDTALSRKIEAARSRIRRKKQSALLESWLCNLSKLKSRS
jgi:uncharacterized protein HemY